MLVQAVKRFEGRGNSPITSRRQLSVDAHSRGSKLPFFFVDLELELQRPPFSAANGFGAISPLS